MRKLRVGRRHPLRVVRHRMSWPRRAAVALVVSLALAGAVVLTVTTARWIRGSPVEPVEVRMAHQGPHGRPAGGFETETSVRHRVVTDTKEATDAG